MPKVSREKRDLVLQCLKYHKREASKGSLLISIHEPYERTASMFGIQTRTLRGWDDETNETVSRQPEFISHVLSQHFSAYE